jgi:hypothetical protein
MGGKKESIEKCCRKIKKKINLFFLVGKRDMRKEMRSVSFDAEEIFLVIEYKDYKRIGRQNSQFIRVKIF